MVGDILDQVPQIAVQIAENGDGAVFGFVGFSYELDPQFNHSIVVPPEVVSCQEKKNPSAGLVANECFLRFR